MAKDSLEDSKPEKSDDKEIGSSRHVAKKRKLDGDMKGASAAVAINSTSQTNGATESSITSQLTKQPVANGTEDVHAPGNKRRQKKKSKDKTEKCVRPFWKVASAIGGRFLSLDPIFVRGEKHLLLATRAAIHVYSCSTSLLVRSLIPDSDSHISSYALSLTDPENLYIGTFSGQISKWSWSTGHKLTSWSGPSNLIGLSPSSGDATDDYQEFLYTVHIGDDRKKVLRFLRLGKGSKLQSQFLLERTGLSSHPPCVSSDGKVCVLAAGRGLIFGAVHQLTKPKGDTKSPTWREISVPEEISSIDVRERSKAVSHKAPDPALDIVVGTRRGPILVYDDVYGKLLSGERQSADFASGDLIPRRLHWHRDIVNSVRWSRDGNYIISGGKETVLVIWQLDTSQKQFLPHLSAEITKISVSPAGTSYAVELGNNSTIVLATSELRPTASMSGLDVPDGHRRPKDNKSAYKAPRALACVNANRPDEILFVAYSMLQTFDTRTSQSLSRQALTRNNITEVNINPKGLKIKDPVVKHISTSNDGTWLAVVDEWSPPTQDLDPLYPRKSSNDNRSETFLKLWTWNATNKLWELSARIDGPHSGATIGKRSILELQSNPVRVEYATVGDDGNVKVWSPKTRTRDGQPVKNKDGLRFLDWSCRYTIKLRSIDNPLTAASLAFSEDGSVLIAAIGAGQTASQVDVQIMDNISGTLQPQIPLLSSTLLPRLAILGHHLITVSSSLQILDLVRQTILYKLPINPTKLSPTPMRDGHLAVNSTSKTFAIAFPMDLKKDHIPQTQFAVHTTDQAKPVFTSVLPYHVTALLPINLSGGYITIDEDGVVRRVQPSNTSSTTFTQAMLDPETKLGLEDMFGSSRRKSLDARLGGEEEVEAGGPDTAVSGGSGAGFLTELVATKRSGGTGEIISVANIFEHVAMGLIGRKTTQ